MERGGKKTAAAVHHEVTRELDALLPRVFAERRKTGDLDLEAVELAFRTAIHSAGAAGLSELLREPGTIPTTVPCACGRHARYKDLRRQPILTVLGPAHMLRAYYWCAHCRQGGFPADCARDMEATEFSPGVRRMLALVDSECCCFDQGRQQMELLADREVTAKAVERVTEAIGADIARRQQEAIETAAEFSRRIYTEAPQRGWSRAQVKVVMEDGAEWIWNIAEEQSPGATQSSISITPVNICGISPANFIPATRNPNATG